MRSARRAARGWPRPWRRTDGCGPTRWTGPRSTGGGPCRPTSRPVSPAPGPTDRLVARPGRAGQEQLGQLGRTVAGDHVVGGDLVVVPRRRRLGPGRGGVQTGPAGGVGRISGGPDVGPLEGVRLEG